MLSSRSFWRLLASSLPFPKKIKPLAHVPVLDDVQSFVDLPAVIFRDSPELNS